MAEVEQAMSSGTLDVYLKSKPYGSGTLFDLFSGEVAKTTGHKDFVKVDQALQAVYGVAYGNASSVRDFNKKKERS